MIESKSESVAIQKMNLLGRNHTPFFFLIDYEKRKPIIEPVSGIDVQTLCYSINGLSNHSHFKVINESFEFLPSSIPFEKYQRSFDQVMDQIHLGNSYLLNLTFPTKIKTNLSLKEIYTRASAPFKLWIKDQLVIFSPEPFVNIIHGEIIAHPMKGTIDAAIPNAQNRLKNDLKERNEHATIVDLIRNDLNLVASKVRVSQYRYFDKIITNNGALWQTSSKIEGKLPHNYRDNLGSIIYKLLPAGSISGAPKQKTVEIIKQVESYNRGYYTGVFGVFDGKNLYSGIAIRYIEQQHDSLVFKSGGGITCLSEVLSEYQELSQKVYLPFSNRSYV